MHCVRIARAGLLATGPAERPGPQPPPKPPGKPTPEWQAASKEATGKQQPFLKALAEKSNKKVRPPLPRIYIHRTPHA